MDPDIATITGDAEIGDPPTIRRESRHKVHTRWDRDGLLVPRPVYPEEPRCRGHPQRRRAHVYERAVAGHGELCGARSSPTTYRLRNLIDKGNRPTFDLEPPDVEGLCQQAAAAPVDEVTCREVARIGASRYNNPPGSAVERLHDDPRVVPGLCCLREREENGAPARQQLWAVRTLTRIQLHEILSSTPGGGRHSPDPARTLPIQDRVVGCPARAERGRRRAYDDGRAAVDGHFLEVPLLPEAHPLSVW